MIVYSLGTVFTPLISLALWLSASNFSNLPYSKDELIVYFVAISYIVILTEMWQSWFMMEDIRNGNFSTLLTKPLSVFPRYCVENLSDKAYKIAVITFGGTAICLFLRINPLEYIHLNLFSGLLFVLSILLGYTIFFMIELSIGLSAVWLSDIDFLKNFLGMANAVFSGRFAPISFYPPALASIMTFLPFKYVAAFPADLLLSKLNTGQILMGFTIEIAWVIVSVGMYKIILKKFNSSYQGYGS